MCTTMIITKGASYDGSTMITHSDDNELSDQRLILVPAMDHKKGATREVFACVDCIYPRLVCNNRGPGYKNPRYPLTTVVGLIPQVAHTYAYFDGNYGIMNEHNLMMGECTDAAAKYQPDNPVTEKEAKKSGTHIRYFYSAELSRVALEQCRTARDAVKLMGHLIDTYGYFSTGETLLVGDENEAWVFEMCALPDEVYHSAWVAQKVPDGEMFVAANEFRIRMLKLDSPNDFLYSKLLIPGVKKVGWAPDNDDPIDWLSTVSTGEYNHPYYSLRRVWRVFDRVNPDLGLSPWVDNGFTTAYPFSITPKNKLKTSDVFALYRDHYEGTQFDLTKGVVAGPFGDPNRYVGPYDGNPNNASEGLKLYGAWERPVSVYYQGYTYVAKTNSKLPDLVKGMFWFGPDVSFTTCFVPFSSKVTRLPTAYQVGCPQKSDRNVAWWAFNFVANWARLNFQRMTRVDILPLQQEIEQKEFELVQSWNDHFKKTAKNGTAELTKICENNANEVLKKWWDLADLLVAKYTEGYINIAFKDGKVVPNDGSVTDIGYSSKWLGVTNYSKGPTTYDMKE